MIEFELFRQCINSIRENVKRETQLAKTLKVDGIVCYSDNIISCLIKTLVLLTNDSDEMIEYWVWERDFGNIKGDCVWDKDNKLIPMDTIQDLYNYLSKAELNYKGI